MLKALKNTVLKSDRGVWFLAVGETLVWGGLFYIFPALLLHWEADQGWSRADLGLVLTVSLLVSAATSPIMGRYIDRGWGRFVLSFSAVMGGMAIASLSLVTSYAVFFAVWVLIGVSMAGCLYEPCFAYLTHSRPRGAKQAITLVTLVAGFASTICYPIATFLTAQYGWRETVLTFGLVIICIAAPVLWWGAGAAHGFRRTPTHHNGQAARTVRQTLRLPTFWLLAVTFMAIGLNHTMLISHLFPILQDRGASDTLAVLVASLIGPMQVFGRIVMMMFDRRVSVYVVSGFSFVILLLSSSSLFFASTVTLGFFTFALFQGAGYGVTSITKPLVIANIMGRSGFGAISGLMSVPYLMAYAFAPSLAAYIWTHAGYDAVLALCFVLAVIGAVCFSIAVRTASRDTAPMKTQVQ